MNLIYLGIIERMNNETGQNINLREHVDQDGHSEEIPSLIKRLYFDAKKKEILLDLYRTLSTEKVDLIAKKIGQIESELDLWIEDESFEAGAEIAYLLTSIKDNLNVGYNDIDLTYKTLNIATSGTIDFTYLDKESPYAISVLESNRYYNQT